MEERGRSWKAASRAMKSLHAIARVMGGDDGDRRNTRLLRNALEPAKDGAGEDGGVDLVSGPKLLYDVCSFGLCDVGFDRKERVAVASLALGIVTELLRCEIVEDFVWAGQVGKCLGRNTTVYGVRTWFDLFVEPLTEEVTARYMALLHKMSLNVTKFVVLGGVTNGTNVANKNMTMEYLTAVGDGVHTAC